MKILEMKKPLGYEMVSNFNHKEYRFKKNKRKILQKW